MAYRDLPLKVSANIAIMLKFLLPLTLLTILLITLQLGNAQNAKHHLQWLPSQAKGGDQCRR